MCNIKNAVTKEMVMEDFNQWKTETDGSKKEELGFYLRKYWYKLDDEILEKYAYALHLTSRYIIEDLKAYKTSELIDKVVCIALCDPLTEFSEGEFIIDYLVEHNTLSNDNIIKLIDRYPNNEEMIMDIITYQNMSSSVIERYLKKNNDFFNKPVIREKFYFNLFQYQNMYEYDDLILKYMDLYSIPVEDVSYLDWGEFLKNNVISLERITTLITYLNSSNKTARIGLYFRDDTYWETGYNEDREEEISKEPYYDEEKDIMYTNIWQYYLDLIIQYINEERCKISVTLTISVLDIICHTDLYGETKILNYSNSWFKQCAKECGINTLMEHLKMIKKLGGLSSEIYEHYIASVNEEKGLE